MISFPVCKINLGLNILRKRPDGYHDIETCFYPVPWTDVLECIPSQTFGFTSSGIEIPGNVEDNLCVRALRLLQHDFHLDNVAIHLHKIIPAGAGLGGGSSDAAFMLRLLNTIFELNLTEDKLKSYAAKLGSDCPFFIQDSPMLGTGRGEILYQVKLNLQGRHLVIVIPPIHVSTAEAYAGVSPKGPDRSLRQIVEQVPVHQWKDHLFNAFETSVFSKYPAIEKLKEMLYSMGATYASMSGSGSSVFAIFEEAPVIDMIKLEGCTFWSGTLR